MIGEPTEAQIRASIERDLRDPEHIAHLQRSMDNFRAGRFMSWRIAYSPLPMWAKLLVSRVVDRRVRRILKSRFAIS